jgi:cytochrome c
MNLSHLFAAAAFIATLQPLMAGAADAEAAALATKYNCSACHTENNKLVGPAYHEVAKKYAGDAAAPAKLAAKIKSGGGGVWGSIPMPPNNVPDADLKKLVAWILSPG